MSCISFDSARKVLMKIVDLLTYKANKIVIKLHLQTRKQYSDFGALTKMSIQVATKIT